ncbi:MAG: hypothetical protein PHN80_05630 [Hespellia sp.]|nr:hypothetical protein [Hespellia sp.]
MKEKLMRFMQGRYGVDSLSKFLLVIGVAAVVLSSFTGGNIAGRIIYIIGWVAIILTYFRMFSKNYTKRSAENQTYLNKTYKIRCWFAKQKNLISQRKVYHIYKCPNCKQKIRVPKGKGRIEISCPKCRTSFIKKS